MGGKAYDITPTSAIGEWYKWVETTRLSVRNMVLSKDALLWLCKRFCEASVNREKRKIESFINLNSRTKAVNTTAGGFISKPFTGNGNYKGAVTNNKWTQQIQAKAPMKNCLQEENTLLRRCLVGRFSGGDEAPTRNDMRRWVNQTWKGVLNLQVYDLNGFLFLFEFQTRRDAEQILMGEWRRQGQCLNLEWWSPTTCALPETFRFEWFWIRVLGLPFHLWNSKMMKEIGDACGGWLENEEETELKNHLRWARIRVRGPKEKILTSIEVDDGDLIYSLPIWCELPALYRKKQEASSSREVEIEPGFRSSNILAQRSEALHKNGRLADGAGTSKLDVYEKRGNSADRNHVAGHVKFLNSQDHWVCPRNYMCRENISGAYDLIVDGLSNGLTKEKPNEIPWKPKDIPSAAFKSGPKILNFTEPFIEAIMEKNLPENRNFVNFNGAREIEFDKGGIPLARRGRGKKNGKKHKQKFKERDNLAIQKTAESKK
ncbi:hypothetical protein KY289_008401 [Solanum tuberosum]|nr:hypothetical protein KY289_008401 [Solanum tuberosum]